MSEDLLKLYLKDHLAGSTGGLELCKRGQKNNEGSELGAFLKTVADELRAHRKVLVTLIRRLGGKPSRFKKATAWFAEKGGRVKLNRRLVRYSPLSRVYDLEGLIIGTEGRLCLFRALATVQARNPSLRGVDFGKLIREASATQRKLESFRLKAAAAAFVPEGAGLAAIDRALHTH